MLKLATFIYCFTLCCWGQTPAPSGSQLQVSVVHSAGLEGAARRVRTRHATLCERVKKRTGLNLPERIEVHLTSSHESFNATIRRLGGAARPEHVAAVAFPYQDIIVMKTEAWIRNRGGFEQLYMHELTHCAIGVLRQRQPVDIPHWFEEGLAQFAANSSFVERSDVLDLAIDSDSTIPFSQLESAFPAQEGATTLAYAQSLSIVRFLHGYQTKTPDRRLRLTAMLRRLARGSSFKETLKLSTGLEPGQLEAAWLGEMQRQSSLSLRQLPALVFGGLLLVVTLLLLARQRVRRTQLLQSMTEEEAEVD